MADLCWYRRSGDRTGNDIWIVALNGDGHPRLLAGTPFDEAYASFSPGGTAIVYTSDESGESEVYVTRIDGAGGKMLVSNGGGSFPRWRRDGRGDPVPRSGQHHHERAAHG